MKKLMIIGGGGIVALLAVIVAAGAFWISRSDDVDLLTEAPQIANQAPSTGQPLSLPDGTLRFTVVSEESEATYVVREKLSSLPVSSNAVGKTRAVSGDLYLTRGGLAANPQSSFKVDLRTLASGESRRDNYIRRNTLETDRFPFAEFVIEKVEGFPAGYQEGQEVPLTLTGKMTAHGIEKALTFQVKARQAGDTLTAIADTDFKMSDFGLNPPNIGGMVSVEEGVRLQIVLTAKISASGQGAG